MMDIRELKELLKNSTSVLILDDGEPSFVILDYEVYRRLIQSGENNSNERNGNGIEPEMPHDATEESNEIRHQLSPQETEALERLNREIQTLKEQIEREEHEATE